MIGNKYLLLILVLMLGLSVVNADTVTFNSDYVVGDSRVVATNPSGNYDSDTFSYVQTSGAGGVSRIYTMFNISTLGKVYNITSATFSIYVAGYKAGGDGTRNAHFVDNDTWTAPIITWDNQPCGNVSDVVSESGGCNATSIGSSSIVSGQNNFGTNLNNLINTKYVINNLSLISFMIKMSTEIDGDNIGANYRMSNGLSNSSLIYLSITYTPYISILSPISGSVYNSSVLLNTTTINPYNVSIWYSLNGGSNISLGNDTNQANTTLSGLSEGSYSIITYCNDSTGSIIQSSTVTFNIDANAPVVNTPTLSPTTAYTNTSITCAATLTDSVNTTLRAAYNWYKNGVSIKTGNTSCTNNSACSVDILSSTNFVRNDNITCEVTPYDSFYAGTAKNSTTKTISNLIPTIQSISNYNISHNNNLSFSVTCVDNDVTDGNQNFTYYDNTTLFDINSTSGVLFDNPDQSDTGNYSINITCGDGINNVSTVFWYNIVNNIPIISTINITPEAIETDDNLTCNNATTDADNDSITLWVTYWYINDTYTSAYDNLSIINYISTTYGENWTCSMRAYDGYNWSVWQNSTTVYINDTTSPSVTSGSLSSTSGVDNTPFTIYVNASDENNLSSVKVTVCTPLTVCQNFTMSFVANNTYSYIYTTSLDGIYQITNFYATDIPGNTGSNTSLLTYTESSSGGGGGGGGGSSYSSLEIPIGLLGDLIIEPNIINKTKSPGSSYTGEIKITNNGLLNKEVSIIKMSGKDYVSITKDTILIPGKGEGFANNVYYLKYTVDLPADAVLNSTETVFFEIVSGSQNAPLEFNIKIEESLLQKLKQASFWQSPFYSFEYCKNEGDCKTIDFKRYIIIITFIILLIILGASLWIKRKK